MKKMLFRALPLIIIGAVLLSFSKKAGSMSFATGNERDSIGNVRFILKDLQNSPDKNDLKVRVQIVDASNNLVVYHSVVDLISEKDVFATTPIALKKGRYKLIEFFVTTKDGKISEKASHVSNDVVVLPSLFYVKD